MGGLVHGTVLDCTHLLILCLLGRSRKNNVRAAAATINSWLAPLCVLLGCCVYALLCVLFVLSAGCYVRMLVLGLFAFTSTNTATNTNSAKNIACCHRGKTRRTSLAARLRCVPTYHPPPPPRASRHLPSFFVLLPPPGRWRGSTNGIP